MIDNNEMPSAADPTADYSKMVTAKMPSNMLANATDTGLSIEPKQKELSIYDQAVNDFDNQRQDALNTSFMSVAGTNSDKAAENQRIANQIGVGQDIVSRNEQESKKRNDIMRLQAYDLINKNAVLADLMTDPNFASVAHDDIPQLSAIGTLFKVLGNAATGQPFPVEAALEVYSGFTRGTNTYELGNIANEYLRTGDKELALKRKKEVDALSIGLPEAQGFLGSTSEFIGNMVMAQPEAAAYAAAYGVGGLAIGAATGPGALATGAIGASAGYMTGMAITAFRVERGAMILDMLEKGYDEDTVQIVGNVAGSINAALEMTGLKIFSAPARKFATKFIKEEILKRTTNEIEKVGLKKLIKETTLEYGKGVFAESATETMQDVVGKLADQVVSLAGTSNLQFNSDGTIQSANPEQSMREFAGQLVDTFIYTAKGAAVLGAFGAGMQIRHNLKQIATAKETTQFLTDLSKNVQATKLKGRSPSALANFVAAQAQGTAAETMYVDAEEMSNVLNQSGLTAQQIDNALPGVREQLSKATSGGDIQIPTAQFAANIVGTKLEAPLMEHARLAPDAISAKQAIAQQESMQQNMKDAQAEMAVQEVTNAQFVREAKEIEKVVNDQLVAAGRPPTEALFAAKLVQARAVTGAAAAGITPAQWVARHPVPTFQSQQQAAQQAPAKPFVPKVYQETTVTPEQTASLTEPLAAAESELAEAKTANSITERGGKQIGDSLSKLKMALTSGKLGEIATQAWKLLERLKEIPGMKVASELAAKTLAALTKLGVEFYDPTGRTYTEGWTEVEIVSWLPYEEGVSKDQPFVEKVISPVVRRNGETIQRGQVVAREGRINHEENLASQAKDAEIEAKMQSELDALQTKLKEEGKTDEAIKQLVAERKAELEAKVHEERYGKEQQQAPAQGSLEQAAAPSSGVFDANNPPAPAKGERAIFAVMDYDGKIYYDRDATMHGDLVDTFPNITESIIDGGFIIDGKYQMGMSEGGYSAFEGTDEHQSEVRQFTEQANTTTPQVLRQELSTRRPSSVTATAMPSVTTANPISPIGMAIASANLNEVKSVEESDTFFKKVWKKLLIASGKQMRSKSDESVKEAAKLAVADIQDFVKNNPQFSDYYSQDWMKTRSLLDEYAGRAITDDEFQMYRVICGLTSPNTQLPSNISDTVKLWTHWMENGSFDGFLLGPKPITGKSVVFESDEVVSGTTANIKIRTVKIIAQLVKELGSVKAAIDFLREPVTGAELNKVNKSLGYSGNVSNIGNIRALVKMATGQDKLIPRMFIFGQKVGAYTLNAVGDERFTTVDIWESRYIRSFFSGMFENEIGLPTDEKEHDTFVRFGYAFKDEMERVTGRTWTPSSLQALRWFYIIAATRSAGYSKASTNETISTYTSRVLQKQFDYNQSRKLNATRSTTTPPRRIAPQKYERDIGGDLDAKGITDPKQRREYTAQAWIQFARSNSESDPMGFQFDTNRSGVPRRSGPLKGLATVATHTPGSQLAKSLAKAGASIQPYVELAQTEVGAKAFSDRVRAINANSKFGTAVYVYSDTEYMGKRLFISESGKSGFALSPDGDIVSVFSEAGSREGRGAMALATQMGGTKLDCFDTVLPGYYAAHGFRAVARVKWSDEYTPTGWDFDAFAQFNGGRPDVVYMVYEANHFDSYSNKDGVVVADPSEAVAIQTQDIKAEQDRVAANKARYAEVIKPSQALFQAAEGGARGEYDPIKNLIGIGKNADYSTVAHELAHWYVVDLFRTASDPTASEASRADADILLKWFGIAGDNVDQRLANWNAMTLDEQRRHHEAVAYNWELYLHTGKAPSVELKGVFDRFRRWLTRAYKSIRDDLNEIYKQQFGTDLPFMTDEVRGVFDRMLASEEQIARREAIDNFKGMYQTQEESGMNDATWAAYQAEIAEAHEMAVTDLTKATVKQMEWLSGARKGILKTMQAAHNALRKSVQGEESDKMGNEPVRKAERFFKTGKMVDPDGKEIEVLVGNKIDSVAVGSMYPTSTTGLAPAVDLTKLRGMTMEGGLAPDLAAEMFGFSSGDELIRALAELKPFKDELKERTDARMLDEHGGMNTEAEKEEAVNKALANEVRARIVAIENRYLTKVKTPVAVIMQGAKELARTILGRMAIKDIKPRDYVAAEARVTKDKHTAVKAMQSPETAGKSAYTRSFNEQIAAGVEESAAASEALVKSVEAIKRAQAKIDAHKKQYGDVDPAIVAMKASHQQVIQGQLAKEGYKILEEVEKQVSLFKRFFKDDKKIAATRNMDLVNAARSILAFYGLGKHDKLPGAYLKQIQEYNPGLFETISAMVNEAQVGTPDYRLLTFEEFQSMQETVDALWQLAKRENQIKIEGKMVSLGQATEKLEQRLDVIGVPTTIAGETQAVTSKDRAVRHINSMKAILRRVEHWADSTDGAGNVGGPFTKYIWRPISQALDAYRIDRNKYVKRYVELLKQVPLPAGKIAAPELNYTFGAGNGGIGIAELLGAIMHSGNISNLEKLLIGRKWATVSEDGTMDTSRWDAFIARVSNDGTLTKEHFDFIQAVWDLNEELKPIVQKAHYDIEGYYFKEVEATPFTNRFGTYRGGYVPAKTDPFIVRDAQRQAKMSELESDFRAAMPSTGAGFTKSRVKYNKALSLDIRLMAKHIDDVIRYSHVQPAVKDVLRILKKSSFADKLTQMDAMAIDEMLTPWLNRAARQITSESGRWKPIDTFWRTVRSRTGISVMIGNITNALQQVTGLFMSSLKVKPAIIGNALYAYFSSPRQSAQEVAALSPFMSNRMQNQIFDLQDQMNELILNPNKFQKIKKWSSHHGYFLQSAFQNMVDIVTWTGAYNQHLAESGVGVSDADAQREAVNRADAAVRLTQGTMNPEGLAAFEVGTPFYKTFIQFTGYFNMLANLNTDEYVKIFRDLGWRGNEGKLAYTFIMGFAAQAIISDAIVKTMRGGWEDDDDDGYLDVFMDWIFGSMGRSAIAMVPFGSTGMTAVSQIVMPIIKGKAGTGYDDRIQSSPSISALTSSTIGVGRAILDVVSEDKEVTGQDVKDVMTLISLNTGVPVTLIGRPVSYLVDVNRGKVEPTSTVDLMRGLITGTATKESKKR